MATSENRAQVLPYEALMTRLALYGQAAWNKDAEAFADCFTHDAQWSLVGHVFKGHEAIKAGFRGFTDGSHKVVMFTSLPLFEIGETEARGWVQMTEIIHRLDGTTERTLGQYADTFRCEDGQWRFSSRSLELIYHGPADFSGGFLI